MDKTTFKLLFTLVIVVWAFAGCRQTGEESAPYDPATVCETYRIADIDSLEIKVGHDGYDFTMDSLPRLYTEIELHCDSILECVMRDLCFDLQGIKHGITQQIRYLNFNRDTAQYDSLYFVFHDFLRQVNEALLDCRNQKVPFFPDLDVYLHSGRDGRGNVHFTGYYTPLIEADTTRDDVYRFPLYRYPDTLEGTLPTREEIENGQVLDGLGLELAFAKNPVDVYYIQRQGSGYLLFQDGSRKLISFSGTNGRRYQSISRELFSLRDDEDSVESLSYHQLHAFASEHPERMQEILNHNPSYVFFNVVNQEPTGAAGVPLIPGVSVAVDPQYIPLGSVLLAQIPVTADRFTFSHYEWRILLPQDTGGGIRGPGRLDLYTGIGNEALRMATSINYYGKVYLLFPRNACGFFDGLEKLP